MEDFIFHSHQLLYCELSARCPCKGNIQTERVRYHNYIKGIMIISKHQIITYTITHSTTHFHTINSTTIHHNNNATNMQYNETHNSTQCMWYQYVNTQVHCLDPYHLGSELTNSLPLPPITLHWFHHLRNQLLTPNPRHLGLRLTNNRPLSNTMNACNNEYMQQ